MNNRSGFGATVRRIGCAIVALAVGATIAGCGSQTSGTATAGEIDVRTLDVGKYPTDPLDLRYTYENGMLDGRKLAVMRLADHVASGPQLDSRFAYGTGAIPILTADDAIRLLADVNGPVVTRNGMMFGFAAGTTDQKPTEEGKAPPNSSFTTVVVLQFPDEQAASRAAAEIAETDFAVAADRNQRVELPKFPQAHTHWRPTVATIGSTIARGNYVVNLYLGLPSPDGKALADLAEQIYAVQLPLLDALPPLNREGILRMPYDPDAMLLRTLNPEGTGAPDFQDQAAFTDRGFLHQVGPQQWWRSALTDTGVDRVSVSRHHGPGSVAVVYRARDDAAANQLRDKLFENSYTAPADAPRTVPNARCGEEKSSTSWKTKRYRCAVSYRRHAATVTADQLADVHQRAAAQYALLANSR
ncbi:hypothetical protein NDR87_19420 [Nocardia sp. CDC159]|uniref:Uncharacterized protein n=1 Tax=Nocardia pulmonis TaxID=2951408 RepID=A0A9X2IXL3_9NOCA|nr:MULTISPECIES: hypothetical protein [Nocardia]MCM6776137.1 hypothetical protein [Nocardia pulmonis]MCM6788536.1 hypothetical protein [Nocardia sp. CDC159]